LRGGYNRQFGYLPSRTWPKLAESRFFQSYDLAVFNSDFGALTLKDLISILSLLFF